MLAYTLGEQTLLSARQLTYLAVLMPRIVLVLRDHLFCMMARQRFRAGTVERTASVTYYEVKQVTDVPSSSASCSITKWICGGSFTVAHVMRPSLAHAQRQQSSDVLFTRRN